MVMPGIGKSARCASWPASPAKGALPSRASRTSPGGVVKTKLPWRRAASLTFWTEPWLSSTVGESSPLLAVFSASPSCTIIR